MKKYLLIILVLIIGCTFIGCNKNEEYSIDEEWNTKLKLVHGIEFNVPEDMKIINTIISSDNDFELLFETKKAYGKGKELAETVFFNTEEIAKGGNYNNETKSTYLKLGDTIISEEKDKTFEAIWYYNDEIGNMHKVIISEYKNNIKIIVM